MYENILLLMDCSPVDEAILNHVVKLARVHKSRVHLFHVVHAHTLDQQRALIEKTEECLSKAKFMLEKQHIPVKYSFLEGEPSELVPAMVAESECDLVALATHGHKGIIDIVLGSVSEKLKHESDKPILLLRGKK